MQVLDVMPKVSVVLICISLLLLLVSAEYQKWKKRLRDRFRRKQYAIAGSRLCRVGLWTFAVAWVLMVVPATITLLKPFLK